MQQREPEPSDSGEILPHAAAFARESGPTTVMVDAPRPGEPSRDDVAVVGADAPLVVDDDDDEPRDDDAPAARPARIDPRLLDPDVIERARRVEIYRRLIEQDPQQSLFTRPDSPPRRAAAAPKTLCGD